MKKQVKTPKTVEKVVEKVVEETTEIVDAPGGLETLFGQKVLLLCNYFYMGTLTGINGSEVELTDPSIVYETGNWSAGSMKDAQALPSKTVYVRLDSVEAYLAVK